MENLNGKKNRIKKRNLSFLLGVGAILFVTMITPALADPGQFTGCLTRIGTLSKIQAGPSPLSPCLISEIKISFYDSAAVNALQTQVTTLQGNVTALQTQVNTLQTQVTALQSTLQGVTRSGDDIHITGANLHIESGSGRTDGPVNGLGNLIIGYNELRGIFDNRTGSHNLIIGSRNNYRSFGGIVAGSTNEISGKYASVSGGSQNAASGDSSSVSGGFSNEASGKSSSVSGGNANEASGLDSSVGGGLDNTASGVNSMVSGGFLNTASGKVSSVSGGKNVSATGDYNWAAGNTTGVTLYTGAFFANQ